MDTPLQFETHQKVISYFKQNYALYQGKECNRLKVLYYTDNLIGQAGKGLDTLKEVVNTVHNANIHFSFATPDEISALGDEHVLLVPDAYFANDSLRQDVEAATQRGCRVILLGAFNICNTYGKGRDIKTRREKIPGVIYVRLQDNWIGEIKTCLKQYIEIAAPNIVSEVMTDEENRLLLHLLSTRNLGVRDIDIRLHGIDEIKDIELYSYEPVTVEMRDGGIKLNGFQTMVTLKITVK